jgi:putative phosphoribosyl transferase
MDRFQNRQEAGLLLGEQLLVFKKENPLILAIPRGGVPVAVEVARRLGADLDLMFVKKIGAPANPELAIGAICEDGRPWLNSRIVGLLGIKTAALKELSDEKSEEVRVQARRLRGSRPAIPVAGRTVILIDDGIATGATLLAAIHLLRAQNPEKIIVAAPVAPVSSIEELEKASDAVICLKTPYHFYAVGDWYVDFPQVPDREVLRLLQPPPAPELHL